MRYISWTNSLFGLEEDLTNWEADMQKLATNITSSRSDQKQFQAVMCAQAVISKSCMMLMLVKFSPNTFAGLVMHRSFLIKRDQAETQYSIRQRGLSEAAVLEGALNVIECCRKLIRLGIHLAYWFLGCNLQIACLALCEYLQNHIHKSTEADLQRPQDGLKVATALIEEIVSSGGNVAIAQVYETVKIIQKAWIYPSRAISNQVG